MGTLQGYLFFPNSSNNLLYGEGKLTADSTVRTNTLGPGQALLVRPLSKSRCRQAKGLYVSIYGIGNYYIPLHAYCEDRCW